MQAFIGDECSRPSATEALTTTAKTKEYAAGSESMHNKNKNNAAGSDDDAEEDEGDGGGNEEESDDDDDDAGSLVDFVVDDDDTQGEVEEETDTKIVENQNDMDGIDAKNILPGRRVRRKTQFYEQTVMNTPEYRKMMLMDIPADEIDAALGRDDDDGASGNSSEADEVEGVATTCDGDYDRSFAGSNDETSDGDNEDDDNVSDRVSVFSDGD